MDYVLPCSVSHWFVALMYSVQINPIPGQTSSWLRPAEAPVVDQVAARAAEWAEELEEWAADPVQWVAGPEEQAVDREALERAAAVQEAQVPEWEAAAPVDLEAAARAQPIQEWEAAAQGVRVLVWDREKPDRNQAASRAAAPRPAKESGGMEVGGQQMTTHLHVERENERAWRRSQLRTQNSEFRTQNPNPELTDRAQKSYLRPSPWEFLSQSLY
jgi:hypothetical protein